MVSLSLLDIFSWTVYVVWNVLESDDQSGFRLEICWPLAKGHSSRAARTHLLSRAPPLAERGAADYGRGAITAPRAISGPVLTGSPTASPICPYVQYSSSGFSDEGCAGERNVRGMFLYGASDEMYSYMSGSFAASLTPPVTWTLFLFFLRVCKSEKRRQHFQLFNSSNSLDKNLRSVISTRKRSSRVWNSIIYLLW